MGLLPTSDKGNKYLLVIGDYFTKFIHAIPIRNQEAETVARSFVDNFITTFGVPMQVHTDQGANFESRLFRELCRILDIDKTKTTVMRPQSDGMVERFMRTIGNMLSPFVSVHQKDWDQYVPLIMMVYRPSEHETTGATPCQMMFGREIKLPVDLVLGRPLNKLDGLNHKPSADYLHELEQVVGAGAKVAGDGAKVVGAAKVAGDGAKVVGAGAKGGGDGAKVIGDGAKVVGAGAKGASEGAEVVGAKVAGDGAMVVGVGAKPGRVHSNADALSRRPCLDDCSHCSRKETTENVSVVGVIAQDNDSVTVCEPVPNSPSVLKEINYEQSSSKLSIDVVHKEASTDERCVYGGRRDRSNVNIPDKASSVDKFLSAKSNQIKSDKEVRLLQKTHKLSTVNEGKRGTTVRVVTRSMKNTDVLLNDHGLISTDFSQSFDIQNEQKQDKVLTLVRQWKVEPNKPEWSIVSKFSPEVKHYWNRLDSFELKDGVLYRKWESENGDEITWQIVIPENLKKFVLTQLHNSPAGGHLGVKKTLSKRWLVERHILERHSDYGWKCPECKKIFQRRSSPHGCKTTDKEMLCFNNKTGSRGKEAGEEMELYKVEELTQKIKLVDANGKNFPS
ncbi:unnamed protein product [Mytilus edulis]|uniref:Integrase catalytic domain-containing protein n=1 Tax=Mytilus edulis TaxID=6550 RepID=A0A8S3RID8_MYTED|nr:unnamed protein product [Mytilus edulis]